MIKTFPKWILSKRTLQFVASLVAFVTILYLIVRAGKPKYCTLKPNENINMQDDGIFIVAASWCSHCTKLKNSGELEKLNKNVNVTMIPHDHPFAENFMNKVKGEGYPTIAVNKNNVLHKYSGPRNSESMFQFFKSV
jgi:hypothetical protein